MKTELAVEKHGADVEFRARVMVSDLTEVVYKPAVDVVALPAVFTACPVEQHVRPKPLVSVPLKDAKRLARQILGMGD